jgi:hypothetical protein
MGHVNPRYLFVCRDDGTWAAYEAAVASVGHSGNLTIRQLASGSAASSVVTAAIYPAGSWRIAKSLFDDEGIETILDECVEFCLAPSYKNRKD